MRTIDRIKKKFVEEDFESALEPAHKGKKKASV